MPGLPTQLEWRRFVRVLHRLGYVPQKSKAGSLRPFVHPKRIPTCVWFREPHPGDTMRQSTLREYLRKLSLEPEEFVELLREC